MVKPKNLEMKKILLSIAIMTQYSYAGITTSYDVQEIERVIIGCKKGDLALFNSQEIDLFQSVIAICKKSRATLVAISQNTSETKIKGFDQVIPLEIFFYGHPLEDYFEAALMYPSKVFFVSTNKEQAEEIFSLCYRRHIKCEALCLIVP
jgi:hypothetical protein